jgi:hypothetical protein
MVAAAAPSLRRFANLPLFLAVRSEPRFGRALRTLPKHAPFQSLGASPVSRQLAAVANANRKKRA